MQYDEFPVPLYDYFLSVASRFTSGRLYYFGEELDGAVYLYGSWTNFGLLKLKSHTLVL